jgi:hypothetical protein
VISFCHCYCCCFCHYYYDHFSSLITMIINFIVIIVVIYIYFIYHNCFLILLLFSFFLKLSWTDSCKTQTLCSPLPVCGKKSNNKNTLYFLLRHMEQHTIST